MSHERKENEFARECNGFAIGSRFTVATACSLLNRESEKSKFELPEDGWSMLVPLGEFPGEAILPDGTKEPVIQVFDREALAMIAADFPGEDILIDYEHFSHDPEKATNAAGWFREIELREDGLYSRNRYSAQGRADVEGGNYRYISPEFDAIERLEGRRVRPRQLSGAALTNRPALKTLKPLSNREGIHPPKKDTDMSKIIAALAPFLAISAEADEATVLNRLSTLPEGTTLDQLLAKDTELAELRNRHTELEKSHGDLLAEQVESDLEVHKAVIKDRDGVKAALLKNREGTLAMLKALQPAEAKPPARVYDRSTARSPDLSVDDLNKEHDKAEAARAAKIRNRAGEIQRESKVGFHVAWSMAEQEIPAEGEAK